MQKLKVSKVFALILVMIFVFCGCGENKDNISEKSPSKAPETSTSESDTPETVVEKKIVVCWGDSITQGAFLPPLQSYPSRLQEFLGDDYEVINAGGHGENTVTIMARQGAGKVYTGKTISFKSGQETITIGDSKNNGLIFENGTPLNLSSNKGNELPINPVVIDGNEYEVNMISPGERKDVSYLLTLTRKSKDKTLTISKGAQVKLNNTDVSADSYCDIYFMGANGGYKNDADLVAQYKKMINRRKDDNYLIILPYHYSDFSKVKPQSKALVKAFGNRCVNFLDEAVQRGLTNFDVTITDIDQAEVAMGHIPAYMHYQSNRTDVHLSPAGYDFLASIIMEYGMQADIW